MIITIGGKGGSGKGTLVKKLQKLLPDYEYISIGNIKRALAAEMGLTIFEFDQLGDLPENKAEFDLKYEDYQKSLDVESDILLEGRLAAYCQPEAFKIFLDVSDEEAAKRIFYAKRANDAKDSYEEVLQVTSDRHERHVSTYRELYGIEDFSDPKHYDIVVDTSELTPEEVYEQVVHSLRQNSKFRIQN